MTQIQPQFPEEIKIDTMAFLSPAHAYNSAIIKCKIAFTQWQAKQPKVLSVEILKSIIEPKLKDYFERHLGVDDFGCERCHQYVRKLAEAVHKAQGGE